VSEYDGLLPKSVKGELVSHLVRHSFSDGGSPERRLELTPRFVFRQAQGRRDRQDWRPDHIDSQIPGLDISIVVVVECERRACGS